MRKRYFGWDILGILDLVKSHTIPLEDITDEIINNCTLEDLTKLQEELNLLLFLLDVKMYCSFCRSNRNLSESRMLYRREIKKTYTKVKHLIEKKQKNLPEEVKLLIKEFG